MIKWTKPSGLEIETNDLPATIAYCEGLGWVRDDLTVEAVEAMTKKQLVALMADQKIEIDTSQNAADLRDFAVETLFEPE